MRLAQRAARRLDTHKTPPEPPLRIRFPAPANLSGERHESTPSGSRRNLSRANSRKSDVQRVEASAGMFVGNTLSSRRLGQARHQRRWSIAAVIVSDSQGGEPGAVPKVSPDRGQAAAGSGRNGSGGNSNSKGSDGKASNLTRPSQNDSGFAPRHSRRHSISVVRPSDQMIPGEMAHSPNRTALGPASLEKMSNGSTGNQVQGTGELVGNQ